MVKSYSKQTVKLVIHWINNAPKVYESGDSTAVALVKEHGGNVMNAFPSFQEAQIDSILAYINYESFVRY
ncbi:MAG: hypothetical protein GY827_06290 [Cytophagales bacterium]|nr:hypothetical protein [Cytophagales bacterium]